MFDQMHVKELASLTESAARKQLQPQDSPDNYRAFFRPQFREIPKRLV